jgi:hypothetical protein
MEVLVVVYPMAGSPLRSDARPVTALEAPASPHYLAG